uniref:Peptidase S1 domain-containing protein n=1 Tax=Trichuris muris TaxID=70415 RepID=A0A5S6QJ02_TRIMR
MFQLVSLLLLFDAASGGSYKCGKPVVKMRTAPAARGFSNRIVGGWEAAPHSFPWHVKVKTAISHTVFMACGGSLIQLKPGNSTDLVLTAAHCFEEHGRFAPASDISVVVGAHNFDNPNEPTRRTIQALQYVHHDFNQQEKLNDIAVIRLQQAVLHSDATIPVCLPKQDEPLPFGKVCHTAGWGSISEGGPSSRSLLQVDAEILDNDKCNRPRMDEKAVFCAGTLRGGKDSCQGDSGGPLVCEVSGKFVQFGVISHGIGCARVGNPGIYAKLPSYINWINKESERLQASSGLVNPAENPPPEQQYFTIVGIPTISSAIGPQSLFGSLFNHGSMFPGESIIFQRPSLPGSQFSASLDGFPSNIMEMMNQMGKRPGTGSSGSYTVTTYVNGKPSVQQYTF